MTERVALAGSESKHPQGVRRARAADPTDTIQATILVRRRSEAPLAPQQLSSMNREQREEALGAYPEELQRVEDFARSYELRIRESSAVERRVTVSGNVQQINAAFGTDLGYYETASGCWLSYDDALTVPSALQHIIVGVLGLDQQRVARH